MRPTPASLAGLPSLAGGVVRSILTMPMKEGMLHVAKACISVTACTLACRQRTLQGPSHTCMQAEDAAGQTITNTTSHSDVSMQSPALLHTLSCTCTQVLLKHASRLATVLLTCRWCPSARPMCTCRPCPPGGGRPLGSHHAPAGGQAGRQTSKIRTKQIWCICVCCLHTLKYALDSA